MSHQQSREIEQHHARTSRHNPTVEAIHRMAQQTATEVSRVANTFYQAASEAYHEHYQQRRRRHNHYHRAPTTPQSADTYLDDFGIPKEEPLLDDFQTEYTSLDQQQQNDFVFLPQFRFRPTPEGWGAVANLDLYFSSLYSYYYRRGLVPIIGKGVVELVTLFFTLFLSVFLFAYVDWKALSTCTDESSCHSHFIEAYLIHHPFSHWSLWNFNVVLYCLLFLAYGLFSVWSFVHTVQDALRAKFVFEERLGITARKLEGGAVEWDRDVVDKLLQLQESGEYRIAIHGQDLDALVVAQRILRKENFLVALFNRGLLDLSVPFLNQQFFCASLEVRVGIDMRQSRECFFVLLSHDKSFATMLTVESSLLHSQFHVQSQIPNTPRFLPGSIGTPTSIHALWNCACHLSAFSSTILDLTLWITECI